MVPLALSADGPPLVPLCQTAAPAQTRNNPLASPPRDLLHWSGMLWCTSRPRPARQRGRRHRHGTIPHYRQWPFGRAWPSHGIGRMQTTKVACPLCQGLTTLQDVAPLGKNVPCPKCGKPFTVTPDLLRAALPAARPSAVLNLEPSVTAPGAPWWMDAQ